MNHPLKFAFADETVTEASLAPLLPGKDEMNFAESPIALLTDRVPKDQKVIKFEDQIFDEKRKKIVTRRRIIEGSEEYGLPTATDDTVILALIQLTKLKGDFATREVEFTRLELIELLGWPNEGKSYDRIKLSLLRIKGVSYVYDNAWWDRRQKTWTTRAFNIIDNVEINDSRTSHSQSGPFTSRIVWNEVVFDSFQAGFLRDIDFQLCMRLEHPTALRMYRFLGKRFYVRPNWVFDLKEFAHEHMGLGRNYEGGTQIARKLKPAIAELEAVGFLAALPESERFLKKGRAWSVRFVQSASAQAPASPPAHLAEPDPVPSDVVAQLIARGVTARTATELVEGYSEATIQAKIDVFDWLRERKDRRIGRSPAGWLRNSIRDNYADPTGFVSRAEQDRQAGIARERLAAERAEVEAKFTQRRRDQEEADRVDAFRDALTPEQLAALQTVALRHASPETRASIEDQPLARFRSSMLSRLVSEHVRDALRAGVSPLATPE